jgi:hypothetical protein
MSQIRPDLAKRLLFILHRGLTEARILALGAEQSQIAGLADALEILPGIIDHCDDDRFELIRFVLRNYTEKYPSSTYDYSAYLEKHEPPDHF